MCRPCVIKPHQTSCALAPSSDLAICFFQSAGFRLRFGREIGVYCSLLSEVPQLPLSNSSDYKATLLSGLLVFLFRQHNNFQTATSDKDWRRNKRRPSGLSETDPLPNTWPEEGVLRQCDPSGKRGRERRHGQWAASSKLINCYLI